MDFRKMYKKMFINNNSSPLVNKCIKLLGTTEKKHQITTIHYTKNKLPKRKKEKYYFLHCRLTFL